MMLSFDNSQFKMIYMDHFQFENRLQLPYATGLNSIVNFILVEFYAFKWNNNCERDFFLINI